MRLEQTIFSPPLVLPAPSYHYICFRGMDVILRPIFSILTIPDLKIKQPTWLHVCIAYAFHRNVKYVENAFRPPPPGPSLHSSSQPTSSSLAASSTMSLSSLPGWTQSDDLRFCCQGVREGFKKPRHGNFPWRGGGRGVPPPFR